MKVHRRFAAGSDDSSPPSSSSPSSAEAVGPYSFVTLNAWNTQQWTSRKPVFEDFIRQYKPDILVLQEVRPEIIDAVLSAVPQSEFYDFIKGDENNITDDNNNEDSDTTSTNDEFKGWTHESTIFWRSDLFRRVRHGAIQVGIREPHRRLFWVELDCLIGHTNPSSEEKTSSSSSTHSITVSTAHLTWQGHSYSDDGPIRDLIDPRKEQLNTIADQLLLWMDENDSKRLQQQQQQQYNKIYGLIFAGDLNCPFFPPLILRNRSNNRLQDSFRGCQLKPPPTHPVCGGITGDPSEDDCPDQTLDWIFYDTNTIQPVMSVAIAKRYEGRGDRPVSDHLPVWFLFKVGGV